MKRISGSRVDIRLTMRTISVTCLARSVTTSSCASRQIPGCAPRFWMVHRRAAPGRAKRRGWNGDGLE